MREPILISKSIACRLWIDRVGVYLLWLQDRLTIGNAVVDHNQPEKLALLADLHTEHVHLERDGEQYFVVPGGETAINNHQLTQRQTLPDAATMELGNDVELLIERPSPLSTSLRITFPSHHGPRERADGVVMFDGTCILGPADQAHIRCGSMESPVVLFEREDQLWVKCSEAFQFSGDHETSKMAPLAFGDTVAGEGWQFRIEKGSK